FGARAARTFVHETLRIDRGDGRWFLRWPVGALTGRFAKHHGHFDPGQRILNIAVVASFGTLLVSGIGLTTIHGGPAFVVLGRCHRGATYVLSALLVVHLIVALGALPGYRGAWRSMHLGGRTPPDTVRRLWPASLDSPSNENEWSANEMKP